MQPRFALRRAIHQKYANLCIQPHLPFFAFLWAKNRKNVPHSKTHGTQNTVQLNILFLLRGASFAMRWRRCQTAVTSSLPKIRRFLPQWCCQARQEFCTFLQRTAQSFLSVYVLLLAARRYLTISQFTMLQPQVCLLLRQITP